LHGPHGTSGSLIPQLSLQPEITLQLHDLIGGQFGVVSGGPGGGFESSLELQIFPHNFSQHGSRKDTHFLSPQPANNAVLQVSKVTP
jgi:hypothetical protein